MRSLPENLFILPFDHRGSFEKDLFGITGRQPTLDETVEISRYKRIIFNGFRQAITDGIPKDKAGILVDEQFGSDILRDAKRDGYLTACSVEKSGQEEFEFEYGSDFKKHIFDIGPDFVKVLVRYNPRGNNAANLRQVEHLQILSKFCNENKFQFMFELLVPATAEQLAHIDSNSRLYDIELRPQLMVDAIRELQSHGVEPDLWKVEGLTKKVDYEKIVQQAQSNKRSRARLIVLGRGENRETIKQWLSTAASTSGFIGFAVGRTVWESTLKEFKAGKFSMDDAILDISKTFRLFCDLWMK